MQKLRRQAVGTCFELQKTQILAVRENYLRQTDRRFRRAYCVRRNPATNGTLNRVVACTQGRTNYNTDKKVVAEFTGR